MSSVPKTPKLSSCGVSVTHWLTTCWNYLLTGGSDKLWMFLLNILLIEYSTVMMRSDHTSTTRVYTVASQRPLLIPVLPN